MKYLKMSLPDTKSRAGLLLSVSVTCRNRSQVNALSHVLASIDSYINCIDIKWTLELASERQLMSLMDRFGKLEWPGVDQEFRQQRFSNGVRCATWNGTFRLFNGG